MPAHQFDLVIVGAGPAGLSAAARAQARGLDYLLLERGSHLADTVVGYQKRKHVMAEPSPVPLRCDLPFEAGTRESVLDAWSRYVERQALRIEYRREVLAIERGSDGFLIRTRDRIYPTARVVLALGTQGNPNRLGVPGESLPFVETRLVDAHDYNGQDIAVVGGGDSAIEIALALSEHNRVTLVVRGPEIVRATESNEARLMRRRDAGEIRVLFGARATAIEPGTLHLDGSADGTSLRVHHLFVKIGTQPPRRLLEGFGVTFATGAGAARPLLNEHYESSVPGLHVVGAITGSDLIKPCLNQGYAVIEHLLGHEVEPADEAVLQDKLRYWRGSVRERIRELAEGVPILSDGGVSLEELRQTLLSSRFAVLRRGQVLLRQNECVNDLQVVIRGRVGVERRDAKGEVSRLGILSRGELLGELSLLSGRPAHAGAAALDDCLILQIPRKAVLRLLAASDAIRRSLDRTLTLRALHGDLFPELPIEEIRALAGRVELLSLPKGTVVFREAAPGDSLYLIRRGQVRISRQSGDREVILAYQKAGSFFGGSSVLLDAPRSTTVTTIFPTELLRIGKSDLDELLGRYSTVRQKLRQTFEERRLARLAAEGRPGAGSVLGDLISREVVIGTDALFIDQWKCTRCGNCLEACASVHDDGQPRLSLTGVGFANVLAPNSCWQCDDPLCMLDCPPDAIARDQSGEIYIRDNCIGCGNCEANCPYDNIFLVSTNGAKEPERSGWSVIRELVGLGPPVDPDGATHTLAVKCDLCRGVDGGPACVRSCPTGAAVRLQPHELEAGIERLVVRARGF